MMGKYLDLIAATVATRSPATGYGINGKNELSRGNNGITPLIQYPVSPSASFPPLDHDQTFRNALRALDARCPNRVEDRGRWRQAIADGHVFLGRWDKQVCSLGWAVEDVFGLHPTALLARYDAMGLCWLLRGEHVVEITDQTAIITTRSGGTLTYYRHNK